MSSYHFGYVVTLDIVLSPQTVYWPSLQCSCRNFVWSMHYGLLYLLKQLVVSEPASIDGIDSNSCVETRDFRDSWDVSNFKPLRDLASSLTLNPWKECRMIQSSSDPHQISLYGVKNYWRKKSSKEKSIVYTLYNNCLAGILRLKTPLYISYKISIIYARVWCYKDKILKINIL